MTNDPGSHDHAAPVEPHHYPQVEVTPAVPPGWYVKLSWTLIAPDGQANVIASSEPLSAHFTSDTYAATQGELLRKEFPHFQEFRMRPILIGGHSAWQREFAWTPPDGVQVLQHQLYCVVVTVDGQRGVTATATAPSSSAHRFREVFATILGSLRIGEVATA